MSKLFWGFALLISLAACQSTDQSHQETTEIPTNTFGNEYLDQVLERADGHLRGVSIGDTFSKVLQVETALMAEDSVVYKRFTQSLSPDDQEFADIYYYLDDLNRVGAIQIDVFLNEKLTVETAMSSCMAHFEKKYGSGKELKLGKEWELPNGVMLTLSDVSVNPAPGLRIMATKRKKYE